MAPLRSLKKRAPSDQPYTGLASKPHSQDVFMLGQLPWASSLVLDNGSAAADTRHAQTISFAPNVTPRTFTAPPPPDEDDVASPLHSSLFPDPADVHLDAPAAGAYQPATKRRRKGGSKAKPPSSSASTFASSPSSSKANSPRPGAVDDGSSSAPAPEPAHIPRPPNAFILFRSSFIRSQHVSAATEGNHGTLSKIVGMLWHALSYEERQVWQGKARRALAEHRRMYPGYSFRPTKEKIAASKERIAAAREKESEKEKQREHPVSAAPSPRKNSPTKDTSSSSATTSMFSVSATEVPKRRTRVVGPRDLARCERIASLLARGLKGAALDAAMREFDATRAPAPFTATFEEPLTAQVYEGRASANDASSEKVEECVEETKASIDESKVDTQMQKRQRPALPLRAIRRSSSAPLLDVEATAIGRRQSAFMLAPSSNSPTALHSHQNFQHYQQQEHVESRPIDLHTHAPTPIRAARKRSASSSPPMRPRALPAHLNHLQSRGSYSSMAFSTPSEPYTQTESQVHADYSMQYDFAPQQQQHHQQPFGLQLDTSFPQASNMYHVQPRTAHPLSRQPTEILFDSNESVGGGSWYNGSESSGSSISSTESAWDAQCLDFSSFSFANPNPGSGAETPVSAHPVGAGEGYSPFDHAPLTSTEEIDYAGMPTLVEPPAHHPLAHFSQQQQHETVYGHQQQSHPHQALAIQTSWSSSDFDFEVPPSSAVSGVFDYTPSSASASTYDFADAALSPTSAYALPSSPGDSDIQLSSSGAHTPCDDVDAREAWSNVVETRDLSVGDMGLGIGSGVNVGINVDISADVRERLVSLFAHAEKLGVPGFGACAEDGMDGETGVGCRGVNAAEFGAFARFMAAGANHVV